MKRTLFAAVVIVALSIVLAGSAFLHAQEEPTVHHHYKLIDLGTFGGHGGGFVNPSARVLTNQGMLVGASDTANSDPFAPNLCFYDCFVNRGFFWQNGALTELPPLSGGPGLSSIPSAVNSQSQSVGQAQNGDLDSTTGWPESRPVLWEHGQAIAIPTLGGTQGIANAINNRGQIIGASFTATPDPFANALLSACFLPSTTFGCSFGTFATNATFFPGTTETHAFLWHNGNMRDLGTLGGPDSAAWIINDQGDVAGWSFTSFVANASTGVPTLDPFLWTPATGVMRDLGSLGGTFGAPFWLNHLGLVVGTSNLLGDNANHPFLWDHETMKDLGTFGGTFGTAYSINDQGEVVGTASDQTGLIFAFFWKNGVMKNLGTVDGDQCSQAFSINSVSQIVGVSDSCDTGADLHGFLGEKDEPIVDLNKLVVPASDLTVINAVFVNDSGEIACIVRLPNGDNHPCVLIPCDNAHSNIEECDYSSVPPSVPAALTATRLPEQGSRSASNSARTSAERMAGMVSSMYRRPHRF